MSSKKNIAPNGVLIAVGAIILMIAIYLILTFVFPEIFHGLSTGEVQPTEPSTQP